MDAMNLKSNYYRHWTVRQVFKDEGKYFIYDLCVKTSRTVQAYVRAPYMRRTFKCPSIIYDGAYFELLPFSFFSKAEYY